MELSGIEMSGNPLEKVWNPSTQNTRKDDLCCAGPLMTHNVRFLLHMTLKVISNDADEILLHP